MKKLIPFVTIPFLLVFASLYSCGPQPGGSCPKEYNTACGDGEVYLCISDAASNYKPTWRNGIANLQCRNTCITTDAGTAECR